MQRKGKSVCFPLLWERLRRPMVTGSTLLERGIRGCTRTACRPARSMHCSWHCIPTGTDAIRTCSPCSVMPRPAARRYVSMNRVCRSCTITGTNMSTGTILKSSSTGEPTSHWTMSRRNNIREYITERYALCSI